MLLHVYMTLLHFFRHSIINNSTYCEGLQQVSSSRLSLIHNEKLTYITDNNVIRYILQSISYKEKDGYIAMVCMF